MDALLLLDVGEGGLGSKRVKDLLEDKADGRLFRLPVESVLDILRAQAAHRSCLACRNCVLYHMVRYVGR